MNVCSTKELTPVLLSTRWNQEKGYTNSRIIGITKKVSDTTILSRAKGKWLFPKYSIDGAL
jgi:hypothetical protein